MLKPVLVKGHRLRDEFACPITRELMREPVIAADGHTYDKEAIEMWLRNHDTSPKTGQPMDHLLLVANHNLKRLIKDLIKEGAEGLYVKEEGEDDGPNAPYRFALVPEQVLILKCLGPVESDWNGKSFRVTERGCIGGRKQPAVLNGCDFMHFSDATVSRRHFEILFEPSSKTFFLKDFGSAGGTFVRVPYGTPKPLHPGMMIMLGKHQLVVSEAASGEEQAGTTEEQAEPKNACEGSSGTGAEGMEGQRGHQHDEDEDSACKSEGGVSGMEIVAQATMRHPRDMENPADARTPRTSDDGLDDDEGEGSAQRRGGRGPRVSPSGEGGEEKEGGGDMQDGSKDGGLEMAGKEAESEEGGAAAGTVSGTERADEDDDVVLLDADSAAAAGGVETSRASPPPDTKVVEQMLAREAKLAAGYRSVTLRCFAPEGTPIQNREYQVGLSGASLGRKQANTITFSQEVNGTVTGIDSSISGEHARVEFNGEKDCLEILDGTASKPSTNGTWFRLSRMHEESESFPVASGAEMLVGTVRFVASTETMVAEKELHGAADIERYMQQAAATSGK